MLPAILYDNRFNDGTPVGSATAGGDALNVRDWRPYTSWRPGTAESNIKVDCLVPRSADYALIWGHDLHSQNIAVRVHGSANDFVNTVALGSIVPANDNPVALFFSQQSFRYWRFLMTRRNRLTWTEDFTNAAWLDTATVNANVAAAPDDTVTADELVNNGVDAFSSRFQLVTLAASTDYYASCFMKEGTSALPRFLIRDNAGGPNVADLEITWTAGVPSTFLSNGATEITYTAVGDGWYRVSFRFTTTANTVFQFRIEPDRNATGATLLVWGAMVNNNWDNVPWAYSKAEGSAPDPTLSIAAIGNKLQLPAGLDNPDPVKREPVGRFNRSEEGHPLGQTVRFEKWDGAMRVPFVSWDWLRQTWRPAWDKHLRSTPFVFAWEPDTRPDELLLVNQVGGYSGPHSPGQIADLRFRLSGLALP